MIFVSKLNFNMDAELKVEVIYVDVARSFKKSLLLPAGSRVADALAASGIERELGAVNPQRIGIFNRPCTRQTFLRDGDRVEVYRNLQVDPKQARRMRAKKID